MNEYTTSPLQGMDHRELLERLYSSSNLSTDAMLRNFPVYAPRFHLARFLAHVELFKKVADLPGVIVDLGVFQGASVFTWAKLCEIFCPADVRKVVYGFDTFEGFPGVTDEDGGENQEKQRKHGGFDAGGGMLAELELARDAFDADRHFNKIPKIEFVKGDVAQTIPEFVKEKGNGLRVALLNLDADLYAPTKVALENFVPLMVKGGVILADEYGDVNYGGETQAIDEYFHQKFGRKPTIRAINWHRNPSAYIEVDW